MWTWLVIGGVLLAAEMATGTFALLFAGLGALAAAALAYAVADSLTLQVVIFALATMVGTLVAWQRVRGRPAAPMADDEIGQAVQVVEAPDGAGRLRVRFRGSEWPARPVREGLPLEAGTMLVVVGKEGSLLVVGERQDISQQGA